MESAADRKARLKSLRAACDDQVGGTKKLKFRNYQPKAEELKESRLEATPAPSEPVLSSIESAAS